ncbi:MAG: hypothetical protein IMZ66_07100, partial [Planctomycetes bacterium]|nr:hypothetical protein [Planctomycetota bacterium]
VQMTANTTDVKAASELTRQAADAVERVKLWKDVRNQIRPFDWAEGINAVLGQVAEGIRVQEVEYRRGVLRLVGETQTMELAHLLVQRLNRLPCVEDANIERLVRSTSGQTHMPGFTIKCRFREGAADASEETKGDS